MSDFWTGYQPGFRFTGAEPGTLEFFEQVEKHRYELEPHIRDLARFERWAGRDVLEAGCGIATDGLQFARAGARYTGLDRSSTALELARRRFTLYRAPGRFVEGSVDELPFDEGSFDLVYSHGVIHHIQRTQDAVDEFHRVLRPGGTALVMVYHRGSLNYHFTIMLVRRVLVGVLPLPGATRLAARVTGEDEALLRAHRELLRRRGPQYLRDRRLFLSHNTDGPGNPLSKAYSRDEACALFRQFERVAASIRFLNLRIYPGGPRLARTAPARRLERRWGWHLYLEATKSSLRRSANTTI